MFISMLCLKCGQDVQVPDSPVIGNATLKCTKGHRSLYKRSTKALTALPSKGSFG